MEEDESVVIWANGIPELAREIVASKVMLEKR